MRWWAGGFGGVVVAVVAVVAVVVLAGCGAPAGRGPGSGAEPSGSRPARPSSSARSTAPSGEVTGPSLGGCLVGRVDVSVSPADPVRRRLCVRPGTVVTLELRPRVDDKRWTGVLSSAPALVLASGWRVDPGGTAHAVLRCAGARGG